MATQEARMRQLRTSAAQWQATNPVLLDGELGLESDTGFIKSGDGMTPWNQLPYVNATDIIPRWISPYVLGPEYRKNDMVNDVGWLMIANKATAERAAPTLSGNAQFDLPDAPAFVTQQHTGRVRSGRQYLTNKVVQISSFEVWVPVVDGDTTYGAYLYYFTSPDQSDLVIDRIDILSGSANRWTKLTIPSRTFRIGTTFGLILEALNTQSSTMVTGPWTRTTTSNTATPIAGQWNENNTATLLRLHYTDADSLDRKSELINAGGNTTVRIENQSDPASYITYRLNFAGVDQGNYITFENFSTLATGPNGKPPVGAACTITVNIPIAQPTSYSEIVGGIPSPSWSSETKGFLNFDGVDQPVETNAYGVRVLADEYSISDDWDIMSFANLSSVGGGSDVQEFHDPTGASSWRIVGKTLECWGEVINRPNDSAVTITFPKSFARRPVISGAGMSAGQNPSVVIRDDVVYNETQVALQTRRDATAMSADFTWHAVGEWDGNS